MVSIVTDTELRTAVVTGSNGDVAPDEGPEITVASESAILASLRTRAAPAELREGSCRQRSVPQPTEVDEDDLARQIIASLDREFEGSVDLDKLDEIAHEAIRQFEAVKVRNFIPILALKEARGRVADRCGNVSPGVDDAAR